MRLQLPPFAQLERLSQALEDSGDDLQSMLSVLIDDVTAVVPSFTGLRITIPARGKPVTVAAVQPAVSHASMLLPLHLLTDLPRRSELVFYAAEPGAFGQLAADTRATYGLDGQVELDRHLPAPEATDGPTVIVDGARQRSTINQAIGVLLDQGHLPEETSAVLAARAAAAGVQPLAVAQQILDDVTGARSPDSDREPGAGAGEPSGLDGLDGYPHRWAGQFPHLPIRQPGTDHRPDTFAAALAELALTIRNEGAKGEDHAMAVITQGAAAIMTGAQHAAVVIPAGPRQLAARAAHGDLPDQLLKLQNTFGEGPCLQAFQQLSQVLAPDLTTETRWPHFTAAAVRCGAASMLCTPLTVDGTTLGSLTLISGEPNAFDDETADLAALFAAHATIALIGVNDVRNLTAMVDHRDVIGQAKGVLMERHQLTAGQAFQLLVRASQNTNSKLRDICERLTTTGRLPGAITRRNNQGH